METQLKTFFDENIGEIRTTIDNGEIWFVARDICNCLELSSATKAVERLDEDEKGLKTFHTLGGNQQLIVISEAGLYRLLSRSYKEKARIFQRWIAHDVIPEIRRTGMYATMKQPQTTAEMLLMFAQQAVETERRINLLEEESRNQRKEIAAAQSDAKETREAVDSFRKIFSFSDEDWRQMTKYVISEIARKSLPEGVSKNTLSMKERHVWNDAYYRLQCQASVNMNIRQRNRSIRTGKKVSKLQVVAEDPKLRKIFIGIIKEMAIQYDIRISYEDIAEAKGVAIGE